MAVLMSLWDIIATPFAWLLLQLYNLTHNYGVALILFGVLVKLVLLFFAAKGKESMLKQQRLQPRVKELEKKYPGNTRKYQEEVQKLYRDEKVKPLSGCLWSLIPFPILLALYRAIRFPLSLLMGLSKGEVELVKTTLEGLGASIPEKGAYVQMTLAQEVHRHFGEVSAVVPKVKDINFNFLGINLAEVPNWKIFTALKNASPEAKTAIILLFLIPIISGIFAFIQMYATQKVMKAPETDEENPNPMGSGKTMTFVMPLISVWFGFIMPAGISIYWITQSVIG
ncbi:MAG: YidC/Oxa1 family membrane protein insertase, partial [Oscillospiraceae bacterium]|nr:YidC/Oxa1 family membrane protein insertase [Oscillospiraceae bacterium]